MVNEQKNNNEEIKVIIFKLKDEEYGVDVKQVKSIERMEKITRVPNTPDYVMGVINLRGIVIPIIDLRNRFGFSNEDYNEQTRIIIVRVEDIEVGLIVDAANDVLDIPTNLIESAPKVVGGVESIYIYGVAKISERLLILLNLDKVLNPDEVNELEKFGVE